MSFRRNFTPARVPGRIGPAARLRLSPGACVLLALAFFGASAVGRGQTAPPRPANAYTLLSQESRHDLPVSIVNGQEYFSLDDLARLFQLTVREDTLAGGLTVSARGKTLVLSTTQALASAGGRLVSLSAPPTRQGRTWLVPLDTLTRALPLLLDTRVDVRRASRLVVVGDLKVPRVAVRSESQAGQARLVLDITPPTPHTVERDGNRLVVRFQAPAIDAAIPSIVQTDLVVSVRPVDAEPALAIALGPAFTTYRAADQPGDQNASRLVIDLLSTTGTPLPSPTAPATPTTPTAPPAPTPEPLPPVLFEQPTSALRIIVIDPGHGGEETGAKGPGGAFEKDIALAVARQLRALLESRLGARVLLTRDGDQTVGLDQRAALANNNKADVFVSLHANASVRPSARGAEVFYLSAGEYNADARQQAALEGELLPVASGGDRQIEFILWEMAQLQHLEDSSVLANLVEQQLRRQVAMGPVAIQQAPFRVLVGANMPAVLIELGFVTNPEEEQKLVSPAHQATLAQVLYDSLLQFRAYLESGRRAPAPARTHAPAAGSAGPGGVPPGER